MDLRRRTLVNNLISKHGLRNASSGAGRIHRMRAALALAPLAVLLGLSGCGSNVSTGPLIGPITFTDANGKTVATVTALSAGSSIYLDSIVVNDPSMLGVNWSVSCNGELAPGMPLPPGQTVDETCGFFTPPHTLSGPVPNFATSGSGIVVLYQAPAAQPNPARVTLYASSTADPSQFSSITLSILP
jgi:hypothetical protein